MNLSSLQAPISDQELEDLDKVGRAVLQQARPEELPATLLTLRLVGEIQRLRAITKGTD